MCGILGSVPAVNLDLAFLAHRGPDGHGTAVSDDVAMGHTRLAILDLTERAAQPKWSDDGNVLLTFNGEIYNCGDLRPELVERGHRLVSSSVEDCPAVSGSRSGG
jgi:asparagine synthase (glutamine-hydrolysing)